MKISFQFDHSARRLVLRPESDLEKIFMAEYFATAQKGTAIKIVDFPDQFKDGESEYAIDLRINGFEKERVGG